MRVPLRRRALLAAAVVAAAGPVAGCDLVAQAPAPQWHPAPDVLLPLLSATLSLRDRYAEVLTRFPALQERLGPLRDDHAQHVIALAREIGIPEAGPFPAPSGSGGASAEPATTVPADQDAALADLTALERRARKDAEDACLAAPSYRAALLGSIAACRAGHVAVLA